MSNYLILNLSIASIILTKLSLASEAKVLRKSIFGLCAKVFATTLAFLLSTCSLKAHSSINKIFLSKFYLQFQKYYF